LDAHKLTDGVIVITRYFTCGVIICMTGLFSQLSHALPPNVEADRQIIAAKTAIEEGRGDDAVTALEAAKATGIKTPPNYPYLYGHALMLAGKFANARVQLELYLNKGSSD
jgi:predicted Zn-dependent protease